MALVPSVTAQAAATPTATLTTNTTKIRAGHSPVFSYSASGVPSTAKLYLQRQFGTKHVWKTVLTLKGHKGTVTAPKLSLGRYFYRVLVASGGKTLVVSRVATIYAYGLVKFGRICAVYYGGTCSSGTVEVGTSIFTYQAELDTSYYPNFYSAIKYAKTSCRAITLHFAADANGQAANDTEYIRIVQASADPVGANVATGSVGTLSAVLDGGAFYIDTSSGSYHNVDVAGAASCWTRSGKR